MKQKENTEKELIAELKKSQNIISNLEKTVTSQQKLIEELTSNENLLKTQEKLKASEKKYRKIFENVQDIFYQTNNEGIITEISPSVERYSGYKVEEILGKPVEIAYENPEDRLALLNAMKKNGEVIDYEINLKTKTGDIISSSTNAHIIYDSNNQPQGIEGYLRDISERKKAEELLRTTQIRLRVALDLAKIGSWEYDVESDTFTFDDQFYSLYGTSAKKEGKYMSSKDYANKFLPPEELPLVREEIERTLTTDDPNYTNQLEHSIIRSDGEKRFIVVRNSILKDDTGKTIKIFGANQDITEMKMAEEALKKSEEKYRKIFDNVQDVFYQTDLMGNIIEISPSIQRYSGFKREELLGQPAKNMYSDPQKRDEMLKIIEKEGEISDYELELKDRADNIINASVNAHLLLDNDNQPVGIEGSIRDITERKKSEIALKKSEERFRTIFETTGAATAIFNEENIVTLINRQIKNLLHYSPEEIENKLKWIDFVHPDDLEKMMKYHKIREKKPSSAPKSYETRFIDREGNIHNTKITVDKIPNSEEYVTSVLDITDLKNAYKELKTSEKRFKSLFENNPVPYQSLDINGKYIDFNEQLSHLLGYPPSEILGRKFSDFWSKETVDQFPEKFNRLKNEGWVDNIEIELSQKDGTTKTILLTGSAQKDPKTGKFQRTHCILYDISERKAMEEQIKKSLEEKEMLLKEIHHRVKNNLMVISSLLNIQSRLIKDKQALDVFKESQNRAKSMALIHERLYNSVDLKRIDFGNYIQTLSSDLFHTYVLEPSKINLKLNVENEMVDINTAVPLGLIVNELITNSMKYAFPKGESGDIEIFFRHTGDEFILRIKDDGVGIPRDLDIFNTTTLGLQLVTNLTNQIDGKIELNRENGTDFEITFKEPHYTD
ncbi:PAS domain S-box protein [Methanobacterium alcaliphilum]|uniref:PAS domain S-box protein n=1 Tax=Methanobacterium alcaliphilum TaxID=392018 RepID=UPI00200ABDEF|nr:PAS domain S-box protein [Methanobacterium alcaliphilum]MCK9150404.1 PAS domain S-box protein [Methanobacterium alcaliphilum]